MKCFRATAREMPPANMAGTATNEARERRAIPDKP